MPIPRLLPMENYLDYLANRALPDPVVRGVLEGLWSASAIPGTDAMVERLTAALASLGLPDELNDIASAALETCVACGIDFPDALADARAKAFMIVIQDFQDPYTLNVRQLMKCCVEEITPDGRLIPFCAYNSVGYREQVREQLSGAPVPTVVPNAIELVRPARAHPPRLAHRRRPGLAADARACRSTSGGPCDDRRRRRSPIPHRLVDDSYRAGAAGDPEAVKSCCATAYGIDLVGLFLGESYHPGGIELTRRLADTLDLRPASGSSTSPPVSAPPPCCSPPSTTSTCVGVDLGAAQVAKAPARAPPTPASANGSRSRSVTPNGSPSTTHSVRRRHQRVRVLHLPRQGHGRRRGRPRRAPGRPARPHRRLAPTPSGSIPTSPASPAASPASPTPDPSTRSRLLVTSAGLAVDHVERHDHALAATVDRSSPTGCAPCDSSTCRCSPRSTCVGPSTSPAASPRSSSVATPATS